MFTIGRPRAAARACSLLAATAVASVMAFTAEGTTPEPAASGSAGVPPAQAVRPMMAYVEGNYVVVVDERGRELSRTASELGGFSLAGDVVATVRRAGSSVRTLGLDVRTGQPRFRVRNTLLTPTLLRGGKVMAFSGQGRRDRYASSLWLRDARGREKKLIQFSFGGSPGVPTGIAEGYPLDYSFSRSAGVVAVVGGDEFVEFDYDIWTVDVASGKKRRLTRGFRSRYPAMSPHGDHVAYFREEDVCGGPDPGYRSGDLVLVDIDGADRRVLHDGSCTTYLTRPRWLSSELVVAVLHTRRSGTDPQPLYDSSVVVVDATSGAVSQPLSETDRVGEISVSPSMRQVAYNDWTDPTGFWVFTWEPGSGTPVQQDGQAPGTSMYVDKGRAPHLRGDPTLNVSY